MGGFLTWGDATDALKSSTHGEQLEKSAIWENHLGPGETEEYDFVEVHWCWLQFHHWHPLSSPALSYTTGSIGSVVPL